MRFPKIMKVSCAVFMAFLMSNVPAVAATHQKMIATSTFVTDLDRAQAREKVDGYLSRADVQKALQEKGVAPEEVQKRLASLSDSEMKQLANQMDQNQYGGDILVAILLVVLIIYLIKRI